MRTTMKKMLVPMFALVMVLAVGGCWSSSDKDKVPPDPNRAVTLVISDTFKPAPLEHVKNLNDPQEVITFARNLSNIGRFQDSAEIYLDAAKRFVSIGRRFEFDCKKAAVREYWLDGDFSAAQKLLDTLDKDRDIYSKATEAEGLRSLRELLKKSEQLKTAKR